MIKKVLITAIIFLLTIGTVSCGFNSGNNDKDNVVLRIGYQKIPNTEAIAKANKWHEEKIKNATIEWYSFDAGRDVNTALASGSIDIGTLGSTLVATGLSKGLDYQVIWIADVIGDNEALAVKNESSINNMEDIKGNKIAVTFGSTTHYTLLAALKMNNIREDEVNIIDMRPPDMLAAWSRDDIDGGYVWQPTLQHMIDDDGKIIITSGDLVEGGYITADVIVVRREFAQQHPEIVKDYIASEIRAVESYRENPDLMAEAIAKEFNIEKETALGMMNELIWLSAEEQLSEKYLGEGFFIGHFAQVLEDTTKFLKDNKLLSEVPDYSYFKNSINPTFIHEANQ